MHDIRHSYVNVSIYITEFAVNISDLWFMTTKKFHQLTVTTR